MLSPNVQPAWVEQHSGLAAWIISGCFVGALSAAGFVVRKVIAAFDALDRIERVQTVQAENHLQTIQGATLSTRDETIKTNAKLDVQTVQAQAMHLETIKTNAKLDVLITVIEKSNGNDHK